MFSDRTIGMLYDADVQLPYERCFYAIWDIVDGEPMIAALHRPSRPEL